MPMMRNKTIVKISLGILGVLLFIAAPFLLRSFMLYRVFTSGDIPHKTDEEMIANFNAHKSEFEQLLQMVLSDKGLERVDEEWTSPENPQTIGISKHRIDEYRKLFRTVGVPRGFAAYSEKKIIEFISSTQGIAGSGSSKSYVYIKTPPDNLVASIDGYRKIGDNSYPVYRHIESNWYLCFDAD